MVHSMSMFAQVWKLAHFGGRKHVLGKKGRGWQPFLGLQPTVLLIFVKT